MQKSDGTMRPATDAEVASAEKGMRPFRMVAIGDEVEINGARFRVRKITRKDVILRGVAAKGE